MCVNSGCEQTKLLYKVSVFISLTSLSEFILLHKLTVAFMKGNTAADTYAINAMFFLMTVPE